MSFDYTKIDLPVVEIVAEVQEHLASHNTLIVHAPPGAGKSTLLPLTLLDATWPNGKKIVMLEPRRLAARTIAERMAYLLNEKVGDTVGYRIRFDTKVGKNTKIEVVTEGILTRMLHSDNSLEDIGLVIFDEFHERSIHADVSLALCREAQQILRPDLRIMVMSATLDLPQLETVLQAPIVQSKGRQYPVEVIYSGDTDLYTLPELCARLARQVVQKHPQGDILVFLPGEGEIRKTEEQLKGLSGILVAPLYGQLPQHLQQRAIMPNRDGLRKIVLATSIAETSLTIEGISIVIDCGFSRVQKFDPKSGLSRLETVPITKDAADQRAGRSGRLGPGWCYRMWTKATHERLADHRVPEILEADLAPLLLDMAQWGVINVSQLAWLTPPPKGALAQASDTLHQINALENSKITAHGKKIHRLPCHPRIAHMLTMAEEMGQMTLATDIAALVEEKDPLGKDFGVDINLRIEALRRHRAEKRDGRSFSRVEQVAANYRQMLDISAENDATDHYISGLLLAYAYPERIASARPGNNAQFQLSNGKYAMLGHRDDLAAEPWLAVASIDARDGMGKIFLAAPLNPRDLLPMIKKIENISWDTKKGGLTASEEWRIGSIVLQSKPLPHPDASHLAKAISEAIKKEGQHLLNMDDDFVQWQCRVQSLRKWRPQEKWPDVSTTTLLQTNAEWLSFHLPNIKKPEDLKKINLVEVLHHSLLDFAQQEALEKLAPQKLAVPSGSAIQLTYHESGEAPVLAARLQELFGLAETPRVNDGTTPVLVHLLSPGFKPVQVTADLKSFWNNTYFEVRKELKRRYPKHSWPDDPWTAEAVRGVKRKV